MIAVFFVYDWFVERRNDKLTLNAAQSNEIVTSMFPGALRDKIMDQQQAAGRTKPAKSVWGLSSPSMEMKSMIETTHTEETSIYESEPLAELYPACTIAFMDVVGFTAWSSVREPKQVFVLLETVYRSFDTLARKRKVFKVETVGDCYVAASGFPEKQVDHALRMCRFGMQCVRTFSTVVTDLETRLGPDTGDLGLRVGIHSGQVVAGVLRGDRARFQLFGDTMNTCARIEGTSESGRIHISEETAELLRKEGKEKWLIKRQDLVDAKGKGLLQTYWLSTAKFQSGHQDDTMSEGSAVSSQDQPEDAAQDRTERLIDWNVSVLLTLLRKIVARRETSGRKSTQFVRDEDTVLEKKECFLDELSEIINLPGFDPLTLGQEGALSDVNIDPQVEKQLRQFVTCCAHLYRYVLFHADDTWPDNSDRLLTQLLLCHLRPDRTPSTTSNMPVTLPCPQ
jgi:class 3 adenylate cyclase